MSALRKEGAEEENKEVLSEEEESVEEATWEAKAVRRKCELPRYKFIVNVPEVVDDFLRNFFRRAGLSRTLVTFDTEWNGRAHKLWRESLMAVTLKSGVSFTPDALTHQKLLQRELETVRRETEMLKQEVLAAGEERIRTRRETDLYRLQCRQFAKDENGLIGDLNRLKKHVESYEPALSQLDGKYEAALRRKMLLSLEKDRVQSTLESRVEQEINPVKKMLNLQQKKIVNTHIDDSDFPICNRRVNIQLAQVKQWKKKNSFSLSCSIRAHKLPISCISLHPTKLLLASASDDCSWKLWELPANGGKVGQMVLTGRGHTDGLSGCSFHPDGSKLATTSGDTTVRLWDFSRGRSILTLSGHSQPIWGCSFRSCGHFLASCSADRTTKLWDLNSQRCRLTLRRHAASVNSVCFLPFSNLLLTCSADKTLILWDARVGICTITICGHLHPCNQATFSQAGDVMASCDSGGFVKLWDIRKPASAVATVQAGSKAANQVEFSPSGKMFAVASTDGLVRLVEVNSCAVTSLSGHSDSVQTVTFDHMEETVMSGGSDGLLKVWS